MTEPLGFFVNPDVSSETRAAVLGGGFSVIRDVDFPKFLIVGECEDCFLSIEEIKRKFSHTDSKGIEVGRRALESDFKMRSMDFDERAEAENALLEARQSYQDAVDLFSTAAE